MATSKQSIEDVLRGLIGDDKGPNKLKDVSVIEGRSITVPKGMSLKDAIKVLREADEINESEIQVNEEIDAFPLDGAHALSLAIEQMFGWSFQRPKPTMMGPKPPERIQIEVNPGENVYVPWGVIALPGISGDIETCVVTSEDGTTKLGVIGVIKKKDEKQIHKLCDLTRKIVKEKSLYKGRAIDVDFRPKNNQPIKPKFMDISRPENDSTELILSRDVQEDFECNVLTPIRSAHECREKNIPLRRGVLLYGPFGTGKTLSAGVVARVAIEHGWTFIFIEDSRQLIEARKLAARYAPAVIFAEDIDKIIQLSNTKQDEVRNILDSISTKKDEVLLVCTTNHFEQMRDELAGLMRPGRLDTLIHVDYPDSEAAIRLVRHYAGNELPPDENLDKLAPLVEKQSAAMIREVVERAKLGAVYQKLDKLNEKSLILAANSLRNHMEAVKPQQAKPKSPTEEYGGAIGQAVLDAFNKNPDKVQEIGREFGKCVKEGLR